MSTQYVILVGGIGGNELWVPNLPVLGDLRLWLDPIALLAQGWRMLGLSPDGITPEIPLLPRLKGLALLPDYYDALIQWVVSLDWTPIAYEQDWRLTQARCVPELVQGIATFGAAQPVHLVAHSRGGLVLRAALASMSAPDRARYVGRVVGLGVPHYGSWDGVQLVGGSNQTVRLLRLVLGGSQTIAVPPAVHGSIYQIIGTWPGAYELMPKPFAPGSPPGSILACYDPQTWDTIRPTVLTQWLNAAYAWWQSLAEVPADVKWLDVVGVGQVTTDQLIDRTRPDLAMSYSYAASGDGVVPARWATSGGRPTVQLPVTHGALPYDPGVHQAVQDWLTGS